MAISKVRTKFDPALIPPLDKAYPLIGPALLREIEQALENNGKGSADVLWVGTADVEDQPGFCVSWDRFTQAILSKRALSTEEYAENYDVHALAFVGDRWWLERSCADEDGFSYWVFRQLPERPRRARAFRMRLHPDDGYDLLPDAEPLPAELGHSPIACVCGETRVAPNRTPAGDIADFNGYCMSCGRHPQARAHATHYWSGDHYHPWTEVTPQWRVEEIRNLAPDQIEDYYTAGR